MRGKVKEKWKKKILLITKIFGIIVSMQLNALEEISISHNSPDAHRTVVAY